MSRNTLVRETLIERTVDVLREKLPMTWVISVVEPAEMPARGEDRPDAVIHISTLSGQTARFVTYARTHPTSTLTALVFLSRDAQNQEPAGPFGAELLFAVEYASPAFREDCRRYGASYVDQTGWLHLTSNDSLIAVDQRGSPKSPRTRDESIKRLSGRGSSRVIRALLAATPPIGVRALSEVADVSPATVSKVLSTLDAESALERTGGRVFEINRRAVLERWTADYSFRDNTTIWLLAPRGISALIEQVSAMSGVAVTGSMAARRFLQDGHTAIQPAKRLELLARWPQSVAKDLGLRPAKPSVANVIVSQNVDEQLTGLKLEQPNYAPAPQVIADLLTSGGQSEDEADYLVDVLEQRGGPWNDR